MNVFGRLFCALCIVSLISAPLMSTAQDAMEAPVAMVQRISNEVLEGVKSDQAIQKGDQKRSLALIESKILPSINFDRMTSIAAGRHWSDATPEQQQQLTKEFRILLVNTYSGAISMVKDQKFEFASLAIAPTDNEVIVRSRAAQARSEPLQINYRLERTSSGWKIYDVNIMGVWLVEAYKNNFSSEISKSGISGLITTLGDKNKRLATRVQ